MKLKNVALYLFLFFPFVGPWEGATKGNFVPATAFLPIVDTNLSDLDVRDAQNQPVKSLENQQDLATIFTENLFNLAILADPHSLRLALDAADYFSHLFNKSFYARVPAIFRALEETLAPSKRRFVHNVHNLWITILVGCIVSLLLAINLSLDRSVLHLNLRC